MDDEQRLGLVILLAQRMGDDPNFALNFGHAHFSNGSNKIIAGVHGFTGQVLAPFARDYKSYVQAQPKSLRPIQSYAPSNKVFIVHGHDEAALQGLARFIERLHLKPVVLREMPDQGQTIIEKFENESDVAFAVVLLTPDDVGGKAESTSATNARARQNLIFELGYFTGKLGRGKVMLLKKGNPEIPSDLFGVLYTEMDTNEVWQIKLVKEMKAAGLTPDTSSIF
ncbi:TIR domain-containing protein [Pseudomonas lundensis]|uniref:TIR domain-containing protein n=1 Tax=Pseudomonas lundensis TaxID=86185 RepID=UPI001C3DFF80|nr:nucleotide-binding protein [Pseudomonas lundensis]